MKNKIYAYIVCLLLVCPAMPARAREQVRIFSPFNASNGLADNSAQVISCSPTGRMVISTLGHINFYDGSQFSHIDSRRGDCYVLDNYTGHYHLYFDKERYLWLKDNHSVTCVNLLTEQFEPSIHNIFKQRGIHSRIEDLFVTTSGVLWVMTGGQLVCTDTRKVYPVEKNAQLQDMDVMNGRLYQFYGTGEVVCFDIATGKRLYSSTPYGAEEAAEYGETTVMRPVGNSFYQIRNGRKKAVLLQFDTDRKAWTILMHRPYHLNNIAEHKGLLYLASEYGYWTYNLATGTAHHTELLEMENGRMLLTDINAIEFDQQGGMWMGTEKRGLLYSKPYPSPFRVMTWENPLSLKYAAMMDAMPVADVSAYGLRANCVLRDSRGWLWVATLTGLELRRRGHKTRFVTQRDGLANNVVYSIIEDGKHNIWVSTSNGISCIQMKDGRIDLVTSYNKNDGIPSESFVAGRAMKLADGTIVMQALDHVIAFNPADFLNTVGQNDRFRLYPRLVKVMVNGNNVSAGMEIEGNVVIERAPSQTNEINLNYNQNTLRLSFSGLNYFRPQQTYYRVRIQGVGDGSWRILSSSQADDHVDSHGLLHLTLANLRPASYKVEVQASMFPGVWTVEPMVLTVNVNQPWWRATGVYIILFLVVVALVLVNFRLYNRISKMRMSRVNEESDVVKRLVAFVARCEDRNTIIAVSNDESHERQADLSVDVSEGFVKMALRLAPYLKANADRQLTVRELCNACGVDAATFYRIIADNIYKSPRKLALALRLQRARSLMKAHPELPVEKVAEACGFLSPNYFIACFFHQYRVTPKEYCEQIKSTPPRKGRGMLKSPARGDSD